MGAVDRRCAMPNAPRVAGDRVARLIGPRARAVSGKSGRRAQQDDRALPCTSWRPPRSCCRRRGGEGGPVPPTTARPRRTPPQALRRRAGRAGEPHGHRAGPGSDHGEAQGQEAFAFVVAESKAQHHAPRHRRRADPAARPGVERLVAAGGAAAVAATVPIAPVEMPTAARLGATGMLDGSGVTLTGRP